jgi:hypothetical protein
MKLARALAAIAVLVATAALLGVGTGRADPNLPNVPAHRHWINGNQVGPNLCDNLDNPGIRKAFNQLHNNLHVATAASVGPAAPGLHNGQGGEIAFTICTVTIPPN